MLTIVPCASCGLEFGVPKVLDDARRRDGASFHCPNGHSNAYAPTPDQKRIAELEKAVKAVEDISDRKSAMYDELYGQREHLIGALRECIVPGCPWRSRRQIARADVDMGRGIERVRRDLIEHLVHDHGAGGHVADQPRLERRTPDESIHDAEVIDA